MKSINTHSYRVYRFVLRKLQPNEQSVFTELEFSMSLKKKNCWPFKQTQPLTDGLKSICEIGIRMEYSTQ